VTRGVIDYGQRRRLLLAIGLNIGITVMQIAGGLFTNSLGLLSDAGHNASDVVALLMSYLALRLLALPATPRRTFAYKRSEVLAALLNAAALIAVSGWVVYAAVLRLGAPPAVLGGWVALFAGVGMLANGASALLLRGYRDLNTRAAYLHLLADAVFSFGVLISGGLIALFGWNVADPLVSIALAAWMIWESVRVVRSSVNILMEATPESVDYGRVRQSLCAHRGVAGVHDLHIWALSSTEFALSAHLEVEDADLTKLGGLTSAVRRQLEEAFGITHATLEVELAGDSCGHPPCVVIDA
jgi:cobalt-zinc-cadmium efflux system protein